MKTASIRLTALFLVLFLCDLLDARACAVNSPQRKYEINASYETGAVIHYGEAGEIDFSPVTVSGCEKSTDKFVMITLGAEQAEISSDIIAIGGDGKLMDNHCSLDKSPFARKIEFKDRLEEFQKKFRFLQMCTTVKVTETGHAQLGLPPVQPGCTVTKIDARTATFSGFYCFFKPYADTNLVIEPMLKPECATREYLKSVGVEPRDLPSDLGVYLAGDATGYSVDLKPLHSMNVHFSISPGSELLKTTDGDGWSPVKWPAQWESDLHMGEVKLSGGPDDTYNVELSLLVENICRTSCRDGLCSSPCHYSLPVAGEVTLYALEKTGRREALASWYQGGAAPPLWQGILRGTPQLLSGIHIDDDATLEIEARFGDPQSDYSFFKSAYKNFSIATSTAGVAGRDPLPRVPGISIQKKIPVAPGGPALRGPVTGHEYEGLGSALKVLRSAFSSALWPPYYDKVCDAISGRCVLPTVSDDITTVTTRFRVHHTTGRSYDVTPIETRRKSLVFDSYRKVITSFPQVRCGRAVP